jgi:hypothetical protein
MTHPSRCLKQHRPGPVTIPPSRSNPASAIMPAPILFFNYFVFGLEPAESSGGGVIYMRNCSLASASTRLDVLGVLAVRRRENWDRHHLSTSTIGGATLGVMLRMARKVGHEKWGRHLFSASQWQ